MCISLHVPSSWEWRPIVWAGRPRISCEWLDSEVVKRWRRCKILPCRGLRPARVRRGPRSDRAQFGISTDALINSARVGLGVSSTTKQETMARIRLRYRILMPCCHCRERQNGGPPPNQRQPAKIRRRQGVPMPRGLKSSLGNSGVMCCEAVGAWPNCRSYRGRGSVGLERVP